MLFISFSILSFNFNKSSIISEFSLVETLRSIFSFLKDSKSEISKILWLEWDFLNKQQCAQQSSIMK